MTEEDRAALIKDLRDIVKFSPSSNSEAICQCAADEIERLAGELKREEAENEHYVRLVFVDAGANPAVTWKQEAEQLAKENAELRKQLNGPKDMATGWPLPETPDGIGA